MKKPELLIPASSLEVLKTAVLFGAEEQYAAQAAPPEAAPAGGGIEGSF